jgi:hypothetical protein
MRQHRQLERVTGEAETVASHAALRLACGGDDIEPLSATEFLWRPQAAERRLFRCPAMVRIVVLPEENGQSTAVYEWTSARVGRPLRSLALLGALIGGAALFLAPAGWPLWQRLGAAIPLLMGALAPVLLESDWSARLHRAVQAGAVPFLEAWPETRHWLELEAEDRRQLKERVHQAAAAEQSTVKVEGQDRRSAAEILGWPLWHVATGRDPLTGRWRTARGWYARGQRAIGLVAVGQVARGWLAVGQLAFGLLALGQCALGVIAAIGQAAVGGLFTIGQLAVGLLGIGQIALALFGASMLGRYLPWPAFAALLFGLPASFVLLLLSARGALAHAEQAVLNERIAGRLATRAAADDASLSMAPRLSGESAERGLSQVRGEE